jgi:hypothetical protein
MTANLPEIDNSEVPELSGLIMVVSILALLAVLVLAVT